MASSSSEQESNGTSSPPPPETPKTSTWKLPEGIEDHIATGLIHATVGMAAGGAVAALLFKSGKGYRSAGVAAGLGVAIGSSYERAARGFTTSNTAKEE